MPPEPDITPLLTLAEDIAAQTLDLPNATAWAAIIAELGNSGLSRKMQIVLKDNVWNARRRLQQALAGASG